MELRQLRYLVEVAAAGSLGKAAQRLYIAQSAISRQIAELEDELGVVLLRRGPGGREPLAVQVGETLFALRLLEAQCIEVRVLETSII